MGAVVFSAIRSHETENYSPLIEEAAGAYEAPVDFKGGSYYDTLRVIREMPKKFTVRMVKGILPQVPERTIRRALRDLKEQGEVISHPAGKKSYWEKPEGRGAPVTP